MKMQLSLAAAAALAFLSAAPAVVADATAAAPVRFAAGRILVQPRTGLPQRELDRLLVTVGGKRASVIDRIGVHVVKVPEGRERAAALALKNNPHIVFAEVDVLAPPSVVDPGLPNQWYVPKIGTDAAWMSGATGAGVTLAVCDSGTRSTHEDLAGRVRSELSLYRELDPAAVITGFCLSAPLSARAARVPLVWLSQST